MRHRGFWTYLLPIAFVVCSHTNIWANSRAVPFQEDVILQWNRDSEGIGTIEKARLFALTNVSLHDALQTSFASKFQYGLWRPITAIRRADEDNNANTVPDAVWSSLIAAPPYPTYAGNMATIGTSQSTILALFFGRDNIRFQLGQHDRTQGLAQWQTNRPERVYTVAFISRSTMLPDSRSDKALPITFSQTSCDHVSVCSSGHQKVLPK